jgi:desulfoferrodoxin-like iron-binding protein
MSHDAARGTVYFCPVCGAEITVLTAGHGNFGPRCCNKPMDPKQNLVRFYICPVCGAEIAVLREGKHDFHPCCCNMEMELVAA